MPHNMLNTWGFIIPVNIMKISLEAALNFYRFNFLRVHCLSNSSTIKVFLEVSINIFRKLCPVEHLLESNNDKLRAALHISKKGHPSGTKLDLEVQAGL